MKREDWADLVVFATIASERSFKKAAAHLGVSSSALSHTMTALEERLGVRLLHRTTRSVAATDAGERLLTAIGPAMSEISAAVDDLGELRDEPAGRVRITSYRSAALKLIAPRLPELATRYPDIQLEISVDDAMTDIVASRFDAGVRIGESIAKDMVSVRIGSDECATVVASPAYFERRPRPKTPHDLQSHRCIGYRHLSSGALYRWEFEKNGRELSVAVEPALIVNDGDLMIEAALGGVGLTYSWERETAPYIASGRLVRVLSDWCQPFAGGFLYYPTRRHVTPALRAVIDVLRYREPKAKTSKRKRD